MGKYGEQTQDAQFLATIKQSEQRIFMDNHHHFKAPLRPTTCNMEQLVRQY